MSAILTDVAIIAVLLVLNGVFAMSELAIVAAKRVRLERQAESGDAGARAALAIAAHPGEFLSTVQVGITLVGVIASVYGGATIAEQLAAQLPGVSWIGERAEAVALGLVVAAITYCSVIIGELVPKRIALGNPEKVAAIIARPMRLLARVGSPLVRLLTGSTQLILRLFGVRGIPEPGLSEGVLVCDGDIEHVLGSVHASDLLVRVVDGHPVELRPVIREALFVPATTPVFQLLESFRTTKRDVAVVLDEYGGISGVASYVDIVASLLGRSESTIDAPRIVAEGSGRWIADGHADIRDVEEMLDLPALDTGEHRGYRTLAGFLLTRLGRVPATGDVGLASGAEFTILTTDGRRIARVRIVRSTA